MMMSSTYCGTQTVLSFQTVVYDKRVERPVREADPLAQTRQQVFDLQYLPEGWDGYDAVAPSAASVRLALHWLTSCFAECRDAGVRWHAPTVTAMADGEVVLIWRTGDFTLSAQAQVYPNSEEYVEFYTHTVGQSDLDEQEDAVPAEMQVGMMRRFDAMVSNGRK